MGDETALVVICRWGRDGRLIGIYYLSLVPLRGGYLFVFLCVFGGGAMNDNINTDITSNRRRQAL